MGYRPNTPRSSRLRKVGLLGRSSYPVKRRTVATEKTASASTDEATISLQRSLYDPGYVNAMSHFYRGEISRIIILSLRLAITNYCAINCCTPLLPLAF